MKRFLVFIVLIISFVLFFDLPDADAKRRRRSRPKRAKILSPEADVVIYFGDRTTIFQLVKDKKNHFLHFFNSVGQKKDVNLSQTNFNYLMSKLQGVRGATSSIETCPRAYMMIELKGDTVAQSCLHSAAPNSKKFVELLNIFSSPL